LSLPSDTFRAQKNLSRPNDIIINWVVTLQIGEHFSKSGRIALFQDSFAKVCRHNVYGNTKAVFISASDSPSFVLMPQVVFWNRLCHAWLKFAGRPI